MSRINDSSLKESGLQKINWVKPRMPVLSNIGNEIGQSFRNVRIAMSIHLEAKTAYLALILLSCGAKVAICGSNPLSTQDDVAAGLASE